MVPIFRRILVLFIALAIASGATPGLAGAVQYGAVMATAGTPCDMTMPASISNDMKPVASGDTKPMAPCKGMTSDCTGLMGCVSVNALPARFVALEFAVQYGVVDYPIFSSSLAGLTHQPDPFPPRTA